jgi:hypothetical protein
MFVDDLRLVSDEAFYGCNLIFHILQEVAKRIGEDIENHLNGMQWPQAFSEITRSFENKIVTCIELLNVTDVSDQKSQMDESETTFDSSIPSIRKTEKFTEDTVVLFLDFLTVLLQLCPSFTIRLKAEQGGGGGSALLANLALDTAAKSMTVDDVGSTKSAIRFLLSLVSQVLCYKYSLLIMHDLLTIWTSVALNSSF